MPIDLLKFPNDLLREVFRLCDPFDLYILSKCSKKCSQRSTTLGRPKKWEISFWGWDELDVSIEDSHYYFIQTNNPEDYFKTELGRHTNKMDIEFPNGGGVDVFIHLIDIFGIRIVDSLEITHGSIAIFSKLAEVLVDRQMEIEFFAIGHIEQVQDVVNFAPTLSQMNITEEFRCFLKFPPDFHFNLVKYPRKMDIDDSSWFTIDELLNCTSVRIELQNSMLSNHDLDLFFRKWKKAGEFPNLRRLEIRSENIDNKSPILEMNLPIENVDNPNLGVLIYGNFSIVNSVRVAKDDGTVGWLKVNVGFCGKLEFLIPDPADYVVNSVVEGIEDNEDDDW
ncbi:hypothetical protein B9Z55_027152 [Caenorhabditis nigoni]|uniref:F-box domain-containing protein n=1 Tax=Caenorhabditis nigoni TaxID=1611254 RepID=A0A2G5SGD6_9PELO|nr:hypothetical protein B9Z55_027152 [Caenorhabditis nigoni]